MDHREAGRYWEGCAEAWTVLARQGYDTYRDAFNTPAFLAMLPPVAGLRGLDVGCGEGTNTRRVAALGARLCALDISPTFLRHARATERAEPLGIRYHRGSAVELPFADTAFDFVTAFMSLMDVPESDRALREIARVLRPGGFVQFSITHPCFDTPHRRNLRDAAGVTRAIEVGEYFNQAFERVEEWLFSAAPKAARAGLRPFRIPRYHQTLSAWLNAVLAAGLTLEELGEPCPSNTTVAACPNVQDAQVVAYFLHVRARRPG